MSSIDHNRPILKIIDSLKKGKASLIPEVPKAAPKKVLGQSIVASRTTFSKELVHECAVRVIEHFGKHKNTALPNQLLAAVDDEKAKLDLKTWLCAYTRLKLSADGNTVVYDREKSHRLREAMDTPYWKLAKVGQPRKTSDYNFIEELEAFIERSRRKLISGSPEKFLLEQIANARDAYRDKRYGHPSSEKKT
ncbi:hypothetical protein ADU59_01705 (plasmid) [Pararhizobium polonicum]|uniref:Uncharacterized protein n=1 Tax=Pararhizobium polonicum TaxID=1612624 RepID=A0A1C7P7I5_9HYPH|nr:hypothetical protein [Pararhizobium polonicum]OBZ97315.1 hypothetical protein ADU59_01705 [Pararhizobium polonicum]